MPARTGDVSVTPTYSLRGEVSIMGNSTAPTGARKPAAVIRSKRKSEYKTASIPFDPKNWITQTMRDRRSEFERPIPEVMFQPITG